MRWRSPFLAFAVLASSSQALALEAEWRAQLGAGGAFDGSANALAFSGLAYGVADGVDLRADVFSTFRPSGEEFTLGVNTGALWKLEVTQWVPYLGVGVGARRDFVAKHWDLHFTPALGLDYLLNRETSLLLEYRPVVGLTRSQLEHQALLGFELRWGW